MALRGGFVWAGAGCWDDRMMCLPERELSKIANAGRRLGKAIGHYLIWLGDTAAERNAQCVFFLSREGNWLSRHYARLSLKHSRGAAWPSPRALAVSRRSTFLPSLPDLSVAAIAPLVAQYSDATGESVLGSLGLPTIVRDDLPLHARWRAPGIADELLADGQIKHALEVRYAVQKNALLTYLESQGALQDRNLFVADVGWRGTIQDNLARILPDRQITGFYLGLFSPLADQPSNVTKDGFLITPTDPNSLARRLRFVAPLEFAASDETPSTLGYALDGDQAVPLFDELLVIPTGEPGLRVFQDGITEGIDSTADTLNPDKLAARRLVLGVLESPPRALAQIYFKAWRDDRYGAGTLRRGAPRIEMSDLLRALTSSSSRRALGQALAESAWPWALLTRDVPWLAPILRRLILIADPHL